MTSFGCRGLNRAVIPPHLLMTAASWRTLFSIVDSERARFTCEQRACWYLLAFRPRPPVAHSFKSVADRPKQGNDRKVRGL